jgi:hypothetical protein
MNTGKSKLLLIIAGIFVVSALLVVSFQRGRLARAMMVASVQRGVEYIFDQSLASEPTSNQTSLATLQLSEFRRFLFKPDGTITDVLPSFVTPPDVFITSQTLSLPTNALVCVVRMPDGHLFGITSRRVWQPVDDQTFEKWPHQSLSANAAGK